MKKINIILLSIFFLFICIIDKTYAIVNGYSLLGKVIYIDPGHGGLDSGAIYKNILEKDINLEISKKLSNKLIEEGSIVYMTRSIDKDLSTTKVNRKKSDLINRAYLINKTKPDLYISIHINYIENSKWKGLQIFYNNKNKENINIAASLTNCLKEKSSNVRDAKYNGTYYMYNNIIEKGVLIELGFLSNPNDRYRLTNEKYQDILVNNITFCIEKYFEGK